MTNYSVEFLQWMHLQNFVLGRSIAESKPGYDSCSYEEKVLRVKNEVCDLVYARCGTYGRTREIREAFDSYVGDLISLFGI